VESKESKPILRLKRPRRAEGPPDARSLLLDELRALAPAVWNADQPLPLAVGVHRQLFPLGEHHGMSRSAVRRFLTEWTSAEPYQLALAADASSRFDANGDPAGEVRERDRSRARERVERRRTGTDT
jgi:sRNA-binding protein